MLKLRIWLVFVVILLFVGVVGVGIINGIVNGGFEVVDVVIQLFVGWIVGDFLFVVLFSDVYMGVYVVLLSVFNGFGGFLLLQNFVVNGGLLVLMDVNVGDMFLLSFWVKGDVSIIGNVKFGLSYMGEGGVVLYDSGLYFFQDSINFNGWIQISFQVVVILVGIWVVYLLINMVVGFLFDGCVNFVVVDDVQFVLNIVVVFEFFSYVLLLVGVGVVGVIVCCCCV